jgi:trk system potassium uptake protein TrkH
VNSKASLKRPVFSWALALVLAVVLALDWVFALRGRMSYALCGAQTLLLIPWALVLFAGPRGRPPPLASPEQRGAGEQRLNALLLRCSVLLAVVALVLAKWQVLGYSEGTDSDYLGTSRSYTLVLALALGLGIVSHDLRWESFFARVATHPARLMAASFGATGIIGALLLTLPIAHQTVTHVSLVDSLFMSFSAVCVTGLAVNNLAETYSLFGQAVLCGLVQIGGLGIMVLSAAIAILAGQRLRVRSTAVLSEIVDGTSLENLRRTVLMICTYTFLLEGLGISLLYEQFKAHPELRSGHELSGAGSPLWAAVFHGVSAFCNAGFSNFSAGLLPLRGNPGVLGVMTILIVLGGIGFPVLDELARAVWTKLRRRRLAQFSLHTRIVLRLTAVLLSGLMLAYLALEWLHGLAPFPIEERVFVAVFQSASARTAGFGAVDLATFLPSTLLLTCLAMFIGAAPGSTGGGIKVTTVAALFASFRAELTGHSPALLNRTLPDLVLRRALSVASLSLFIVILALFTLLLVEPHPPLDLVFETVSAFTTTGLSTGITPKLSTAGKLVIIAMMFVGRIGPLTLALAVSSKAQQRALRLPEERVLIG